MHCSRVDRRATRGRGDRAFHLSAAGANRTVTELETAMNVDAARLLEKNRSALIGLCHDYGVEELSLFGPAPCGSPARQYFDFKAALESLFGRPVDLAELSAMQESRLKRIIERSHVSVYGNGT
jgi:hypothetical protein